MEQPKSTWVKQKVEMAKEIKSGEKVACQKLDQVKLRQSGYKERYYKEIDKFKDDLFSTNFLLITICVMAVCLANYGLRAVEMELEYTVSTKLCLKTLATHIENTPKNFVDGLNIKTDVPQETIYVVPKHGRGKAVG
ncbi:hypothetical protein C5167_044406 [Papaver somniferum]|uniref:Uncharacterized protein n=1 Tax=Papaver somniferum TaxID=3469 RepID=A0A4Y7L9A8_PAPSO|nr:hypothetical protein C5167_044406 [Papaver somniferum]